MKKNIIVVVVIVLIAVAIYFIFRGSLQNVIVNSNQSQAVATSTSQQVKPTNIQKGKTPAISDYGINTLIGKSVQGRDILAYPFGNGTSTEILFIGGIHGGYEWNTVLVAYQLMDYLRANPEVIPNNVKVTVIPVLNPDGLAKVVQTDTGYFTQQDVPALLSDAVVGRFNANNVDLNRNFDCDWQSVAKWQSKTVSGGSEVFSEPESQAIKNYVNTKKPTAVVVWYSAAGGVYSSSCHNDVSTQTKAITNIFAKASGYKDYESFDFYATTGDMVNWLAKMDIPAISVLLTDHTSTEWSKNKAGIDAVLNYYNSFKN